MTDDPPYTIHVGDCIAVMATLPAESVDAVVCDPPYGLEFMGQDWDAPWKADTVRWDPRGQGEERGFVGKSRAPVSGFSAYKAGRPFQLWCEAWAAEALRVLKPGGHLLAFGGTRTYHRLACGIEDAGFEVRDSIHWIYGSGFPKSMDVAKAIDKALGAEGTFGGPKTEAHAGWIERGRMSGDETNEGWTRPWMDDPEAVDRNARIYEPGSPEAQAWTGWGTALKPGHEPIIVARKPLAGTVADTVVAFGTGALNIDGCRVDASPEDEAARAATRDAWRRSLEQGTIGAPGQGTSLAAAVTGDSRVGTTTPDLPAGRWPANVILSHSAECEEIGTRTVRTGEAVKVNGVTSQGVTGWGKAEPGTPNVTHADEGGTETIAAYRCAPGCPVAEIDAMSGETASTSGGVAGWQDKYVGGTYTPIDRTGYDDQGGASRFFYCAKPSKAERNEGLAGFEAKRVADRVADDLPGGDNPRNRSNTEALNFHPTVKPVALMRYLCRLVTPPGGTVLDPFAGSGTCGIAAIREDFRYVGIEQDAEFAALAVARVTHAWEYLAEPQSLF